VWPPGHHVVDVPIAAVTLGFAVGGGALENLPDSNEPVCVAGGNTNWKTRMPGAGSAGHRQLLTA
jgi:hypothetical protein